MDKCSASVVASLDATYSVRVQGYGYRSNEDLDTTKTELVKGMLRFVARLAGGIAV